MCQLAADIPLPGSVYQDLHRDAPPLFPELTVETPPFQLAVNFPLVGVTEENGPLETTFGTHNAENRGFDYSGCTGDSPGNTKSNELSATDVRYRLQPPMDVST